VDDDWEGPDEGELAEWLNWMAVLHAPRAGERASYEHIIEPERQDGFIRAKGLG
jgi:hypothetical protein